jgi:hypothetical protein
LLEDNPGVENAWFGPRARLSPDILKMTLIDGAAQMRMLSRLGLHHSFTAGLDNALGAAIARIGLLDSQTAYTGELNIMMVGSLAGATGSGTFLQLALALGDVCQARGIRGFSLRGLFLLPDVFVNGIGLPVGQVPNVLANGYASLKELNAVNDLTNALSPETAFNFEYSPGRFLQRGVGQPFRSFALIDFENINGGNFGRSRAAYVDMATRAAFMLIFTPIGQKTDSIAVNDALRRLAAAATGRSNLYAGIGVSAVRYPVAEMSRYLTLRLATRNLEGDWLRQDHSYARRMAEFRNQRQLGNLSVVQPDRGLAFLEDLQNLARADRIAFFREIDSRLNPLVRDPDTGMETPRPRHLAYLDAVLREVKARFWARERLREVAEAETLDVTKLSKEAAADTVRQLEFRLDDDFAQLERAIEVVPEEDFINLLYTGDDLAEANWREYHLQYHIIRGGPHLVEVRAFLYALRQAIAARRAELDPREWRRRLMRAANAFDDTRGNDPAVRGTPRVMQLAQEAAESGIFSRLRRTFDRFREEYVSYYAGSRNAFRTYADQSIELKVLARLDDEAAGLLRYLEQLFDELDGVFASLGRDISDEEMLHDVGRAENDGNVWVYADKAAKLAAWDNVEKRAGGVRLGEDANKTLSTAVYRRYRDDRRDVKAHDFSSLGRMFHEAIVDGFARNAIETEYRSDYDFTVVEAIRREAGLRQRDVATYLRDVIDLARSQSEPFVSLIDTRQGQRVMLWAVNENARAEIGDDRVYTELFTRAQGESPLEGEFDDKEFLCMHTRVNLELTHLAKLFPGDPERGGAPPQGRYARAYSERIEGLMEADLSSGLSPHFTPHIDTSWHRPGALPEIFPELNRKRRDDFARAVVLSIAEGLISFVEEYGYSVTEFSTAGRVTSGGMHRRIAPSHDLFTVIEGFERRPELARAALRCWAELIQQAKVMRKQATDRLATMARPEVLGQFLRICITRDNIERREEVTSRLVSAWMKLAQELVALEHSDLDKPGLDQAFERLVQDCREAAFVQLEAEGMRAETRRGIERLFDDARASNVVVAA